MTMTPANAAELVASGNDGYDLTVFLSVDVVRYPGDIVDADMQSTSRDYCIEAGCMHCAWSLRLSPWNGSLEGDDVLTGPPLVDLKDQTTGPDPLTLLRALLAGQAV